VDQATASHPAHEGSRLQKIIWGQVANISMFVFSLYRLIALLPIKRVAAEKVH
jgi:hypothetical protein